MLAFNFLTLAAANPAVLEIRQKARTVSWWDGRGWDVYRPRYELLLASASAGLVHRVDVEVISSVELEANRRKFDRIARECREAGRRFLVFTEAKVLAEPRLTNARRILAQAGEGLVPDEDLDLVRQVSEGTASFCVNELVEIGVLPYETRTAERRGLRLFGLRYNSPELATYRAGFENDPRVEVRYDPHDIGFVTLVDRDRGLTFRVPCTRPDYAKGLRLHQHLVIKRRAKDNGPEGRVRMADLLLAKAALFALGESMLKKRRGRGSLGKVAQFLGIGRELIDQISSRREDVEESEGHLALSDEGVLDPEDERAARQDERTVKSLQGGARTSPGGPGARAGRRTERSPVEPMPREEPVPARPVASASPAFPPAGPVPAAGSPEGDATETATNRRARRETRTMKVDFDD